MNIVIIEDEGITALFLKEVITNLGHKVVAMFDNAKELILFLQSSKIDLIFMDIQINGFLDGINTAKKVKAFHSDIQFVFLTAYKDTQTINRAKDIQPLGYLIKPVLESDIEAILMVIQGYMKDTTSTTIIHFSKYSYDLQTESIYLNNTIVALSKNEKACMHTLIMNRNSYISAEQLITSIWGSELNRAVSLRELIYRLRKKLPEIKLLSESNIGYCLNL